MNGGIKSEKTLVNNGSSSSTSTVGSNSTNTNKPCVSGGPATHVPPVDTTPLSTQPQPEYWYVAQKLIAALQFMFLTKFETYRIPRVKICEISCIKNMTTQYLLQKFNTVKIFGFLIQTLNNLDFENSTLTVFFKETN